MATNPEFIIDDRVVALLKPVLSSRLAMLARAALARIEAAEGDSFDEALPDASDPFAPPAEETPRERAFRQLRIADQVVMETLQRELDITKRLVELRNQFNERDDLRTPLETIVIDGPEYSENLLSGHRTELIHKFLTAWKHAYQATLLAIENDTRG